MHRAHLFSLRIAHALRESVFKEPYGRGRFFKDVMAGITVGIIAIPLAMALAIASGVPPQYGLYTAIVAGFLIPLTGGSRYSISGPTAAFVVILHPIASHFGLAGLLIATVLSGFILLGMAVLRLGRLIEYIPEAVTLGFTAGIAVVIATLQIKDFFGLPLTQLPESYLAKVQMLVATLPETSGPNFLVAAVTLSVMLFWPRLGTRVPAHLPAVVIGSALGALLAWLNFDITTIGNYFSYTRPDGATGFGIPPYLPGLDWPWNQPGADGKPFTLDWHSLKELLPAAFAIAMLGAIESLLCAVVLDGMTGKRHSANSELLGQGIGNIVTPFFGGITATAALARSAANVRAGAQSPLAAMIHALVILLALLALAPVLSYLPMASMAALLLMVAWNMSEAPKALHLLQTAPTSDKLVFLLCFGLTVWLDMVIAISAGIMLASLLFMKDIAEMTRVAEVSDNPKYVRRPLPPGWQVYRISGPLFFAAADRIFAELALKTQNQKGLVLDWDAVPILDAGGLSAMLKFLDHCAHHQVRVVICDVPLQPMKTLSLAHVHSHPGQVEFVATLADALHQIEPRT